jgi:hypothetical protein
MIYVDVGFWSEMALTWQPSFQDRIALSKSNPAEFTQESREEGVMELCRPLNVKRGTHNNRDQWG